MKSTEVPSKRVFNLFATFVLATTAMTLIAGCPPGTKTSAEVGVSVKVDPAHCREQRGAAPDASATDTLVVGNENVMLDCVALEGGGTIRISFPRKAWWAIRLADVGANPGPGK